MSDLDPFLVREAAIAALAAIEDEVVRDAATAAVARGDLVVHAPDGDPYVVLSVRGFAICRARRDLLAGSP